MEPLRNFEKNLARGEFFGEANLIRCMGIEYFGDIIAFGSEDNPEVSLIYISWEDFQRIPDFELRKMLPKQRKAMEHYISIAMHRYKLTYADVS